MENTVRYKQFDITVNVEPESSYSTRYRIINYVRRLSDTEPRRWWMTFEEFATKTAACNVGVHEARAWIDEHEHRLNRELIDEMSALSLISAEMKAKG